MARQTSDNRLKAAMDAKIALAAEIKELQAAARQRQREEDDRRFAVMGRTLCAEIAAAPEGQLAQAISALLDRVLTRQTDRSLFAFLPPTTTATPAKARTKTHVPTEAAATPVD